VLLHTWMGTLAESIRYNPVSGEVVEGPRGNTLATISNVKRRSSKCLQKLQTTSTFPNNQSRDRSCLTSLHTATGLLNARPGEGVQGDRAHIAEVVVVVRRHK